MKPLTRILACAALALGLAFVAGAVKLVPSSTSHGPAVARPGVDAATAAAVALNHVTRTSEGFTLTNPSHTATFTTRGVEMVPHEGPAWRWSLKGAHPDVRPEPLSGALGGVRYRRDGFEERYVFKAQTIEQLFVLERRPAGGDLVIEGDIACPAALDRAEHSWRWSDGTGEVHLGDVHVFDAAGTTLAATMEVTPEGSRIAVSSEALEHAVYPVTIDPEIGTNDFRISAMGPDGDFTYDALHCAVAYNATNAQYLVVWEGDDDSAGSGDGQFEIFAQRIDATNGNAIGTNDFRISDVGPDGDPDYDGVDPAVVWNPVTNEYLVTWSADEANGEFEIYGQRLAGATGAEVGANDFRISDMGLDGDALADADEPAIACNTTTGDYLVVWTGDDVTNAETEIYGQRLSSAGAALGTNDFRISDMGADGDTLSDAESPAVACSPAQNEFLVVWSGDDIGTLVNGEFEIYGQRISGATGAEVGTNDFRISDMGPDGDPNYDAITPAIGFAPAANRYLVAWAGDDDTAPLVNGEREIFGQLIDAVTGAAVGPNDFRASDMGPNGDVLFDARNPAVTFNPANNRFLIAWEGDDKGGGNDAGEFEIFGQLIESSTGFEVGSDDFRISAMGTPGVKELGAARPAVALRNAGNGEYFVVWEADQDSLGLVDNEFEIYGQRLRGSDGNEIGADDFKISDMGPDGDVDFDARDPAVAYSPAENEFFVVWSADDTTGNMVDGETEIFGQRVSAASGGLAGPPLRLSHMGPDGDPAYDASSPAVTYNPVAHEYLVVWSGETNLPPRVNGEFEIHGQRVAAATGAEVGVDDFRISTMGPDGNALFDALDPAVTYDPVTNEYLVVWLGDDDTLPLVEGEQEIFGQRLDANGAEVGTDDFRISDMGFDGDANFDAQDPDVAVNTSTGEYLVVWSAEDSTATLGRGEFEIYGQRLSGAGVASGPNDFRISDMGPDGDPNFDAAKPAVAYNPDDGHYLVVWEADDLNGLLVDNEKEIFGQRLSSAGVEIGANDFRISDMGLDGDPLFGAETPDVVYVPADHEWLVVWNGDDLAPLVDGENEVFVQRLSALTGAEVGGNDERISDMGADGVGGNDAFHAAVAYSPALRRSLVVWDGDDGEGLLGTNEFEIYGQLWSAQSSTGVLQPGLAPTALSLSIVGAHPVRDALRMRMAAARSAEARWQLVDAQGRAMASRSLRLEAGVPAQIEIPTAGLPPGVYWAEARMGGDRVGRRVVVAR